MNKRLLCIVALGLAGCASIPPYQPKLVSKEQALKYVERCLREQPPELGPTQVQITDEYMTGVYSDTEVSWNFKDTTAITVGHGTYYQSVASADITRDEGAYLAMLYDRKGNELGMPCYSYDLEVAQQFIDGVMSLKPNIGAAR